MTDILDQAAGVLLDEALTAIYDEDGSTPMATLATKVIPHGGLVLGTSDFAAASGGGDKAPTGSGLLLVVKNGAGSSVTVTLAVPETVDTLAVASRPVVIAAGDEAYIPLQALYADPTTGLASWTYSSATSVTVAVIRSSS